MALFTTACIRPAPPLGISTSIYSFNLIISVATSLLVSSTNCNEYSGSPASFIPSTKALTIAILEFIASLPPLNITALPVFKHKPAASQVTLGLASYIIPITPIGTLCLPICNPFGLLHIEVTSPTGSANDTTCLNPSAISANLFSSSFSLSNIALVVPFSIAFSKSFLFSLKILSLFSSNFSAILSKASFFCVVVAFISSYDASFALCPFKINLPILCPLILFFS